MKRLDVACACRKSEPVFHKVGPLGIYFCQRCSCYVPVGGRLGTRLP